MSKRNFRLRQSYWLIHGSLHERVDFGKVAHYTHLIWFYIADMVMVKAIGSCSCLISGAPNILLLPYLSESLPNIALFIWTLFLVPISHLVKFLLRIQMR